LFEGYLTRAPEADQDGLIEFVVLPLRGLVMFPSANVSLAASTPQAISAVEAARARGQNLLLVSQRNAMATNVKQHNLYMVGTEVSLARVMRTPDDELLIQVSGVRRIQITQVKQENPFLIAIGRPLPQQLTEDDQLPMLLKTATSLFADIADLEPAIPEDAMIAIESMSDPMLMADLMCAVLTIPVDQRQALLEQTNVNERLQRLVTLLNDELAMLKMRQNIHSQTEVEMERAQREIFLREQLRVIQHELGEVDFVQQEYMELQVQVERAKLPKEPHDRATRELRRLAAMPPMSPDVGVIRTYLDWLVALPWTHRSNDRLDIRHAQKVLDAEHYGLEKVKDRILEYMSVRKLAADKMKSPILCFVGPPGVGKTSLGRSIAKALGREFVRLSLGGVRDEAEIRGHRRTYIGALPGRILQTLRRAGTINPVFMLDEIDKLGMDFRGDPSSALLEVLDPEQNNTFSDHYLDLPFDLSQVLFITTANDVEPLQDALLDRMELIEFPGYTEEEKIAIARQFLIPRQLEANGLNGRGIQFEMTAVRQMIREYTYESGVRGLERAIAKVCRKLARAVASDSKIDKRVTTQRMVKHLGPPDYLALRPNDTDAVGLATGLAWTANGGDVLTIEVSVLVGKGTLLMTGQLGDVMQESAQAALSYLRSRAKDFDVPHDDFESFDIHVHVPEGAVPKDGPSAGITLAAAIISAFTERKVRSDTAMSGEITLRGKVLPVGAVKEKVLAARRAKLKHVILSNYNKKDVPDIPAEVLADVELHFVSDMQEVIDWALLPAPSSRARDLERKKDESDEGEKE
jgi:ATP-dependent Lon protease